MLPPDQLSGATPLCTARLTLLACQGRLTSARSFVEPPVRYQQSGPLLDSTLSRGFQMAQQAEFLPPRPGSHAAVACACGSQSFISGSSAAINHHCARQWCTTLFCVEGQCRKSTRSPHQSRARSRCCQIRHDPSLAAHSTANQLQVRSICSS